MAQDYSFRIGPVGFTFEGLEGHEDYYQSRRNRHYERRRAKERRYNERQRSRTRVRRHTKPSVRRRVTVREPEIIKTKTKLTPGTVYISTKQRKLFYALGEYKAIMYPVAVGKEGFAWNGIEKVTMIKHWPDWRPPEEMRQRDPKLPVLVKGGRNNPLGAAAIYLGDTLYRIHGTNDPRSIGTNTSSGCIRMHNSHVLHLIKYVDKGTEVVVNK